jgi:pSer/pThr/pTyr-binding forkhead associated (FHA) protein
MLCKSIFKSQFNFNLYFRICKNDEQELVIGRSPNCDIRIDDQLISKMQSTIKYEGGNWILEDGRDGKESTNGTWYYLN